jgi:hypothetical protein
MSEWTNRRMNNGHEWINKWMNEWMNDFFCNIDVWCNSGKSTH